MRTNTLVWYLQYDKSVFTIRGSARVAYSTGGNIPTNTWGSYVFDPQSFGRPVLEWLDYPRTLAIPPPAARRRVIAPPATVTRHAGCGLRLVSTYAAAMDLARS